MSYVKSNLLADEKIEFSAKFHWSIYLPSLLLFATSIWLFRTPSESSSFMGVILLILSIYLLIKSFLYASCTEFVVTSERIIAKTGLLSRNTCELFHDKVESLALKQGVLERILGAGTLVLSGTGNTKSVIHKIDSPIDFRNKAYEFIEKNKLLK